MKQASHMTSEESCVFETNLPKEVLNNEELNQVVYCNAASHGH